MDLDMSPSMSSPTDSSVHPASAASAASAASSTSSPPASGPTPPSTGNTNITATSTPSPASARHQPAKRNRAVLSCAACRISKLRCDREDPCGQCLKRGRPQDCLYAPRIGKQMPPTKGMASRLRRLEGLVRTMMNQDGVGEAAAAAAAAAVGIDMGSLALDQRPQQALDPTESGPRAARPDSSSTFRSDSRDVPGSAPAPAPASVAASVAPGIRPTGQVVMGSGGTTYVGATHFLAMLKDIEDLKSYFEDPEQDPDQPEDGSPTGPDGGGNVSDDIESPDLLFDMKGAGPRSREEFLRLLPDRTVVSRLVMRYFAANSPSQYVIHRPTFAREFGDFWQSPSSVSLHWLAQLYMMIAMGIFYSSFIAPHELERESATPPMERFRRFRAIAGWALAAAPYTQPRPATIIAFLLYTEAEFLSSQPSMTYCYLLCGVGLRLMMKMGMHRDPDQLPNISPFEGEMRRRQWAVATQVDMLLAFHLGLPGLTHGIESDTKLPHNLHDEDFDEGTERLPPARPFTDYTTMTYGITKGSVARVFSEVARLAHRLTPPRYGEVLELDRRLQEAWDRVPDFMRPRPLSECVTDQPAMMMQRTGLASLYNKSLCVLHRGYLAEPEAALAASAGRSRGGEHDYSRRRCLEAALALLDFQFHLWEASQPGGPLEQIGWLHKTLAMHDYLLAAMVVFLVLQNEGGDTPRWRIEPTPLPGRDALVEKLTRAWHVWEETGRRVTKAHKATEILGTILGKLGVAATSTAKGGAKEGGAKGGGVREAAAAPFRTPATASASAATAPPPPPPPPPPDTRLSGYADTTGVLLDLLPMTDAALPTGAQAGTNMGPPPLPGPAVAQGAPVTDPPGAAGLDSSWVTQGGNVDWRYVDNALTYPDTEMDQDWLVGGPLIADMDFTAVGGGWGGGDMGAWEGGEAGEPDWRRSGGPAPSFC